VTDVSGASVTVTDETGPPPIVDDNPPQDLDGDGRYEDIDGNGEFTVADVQVFSRTGTQTSCRTTPRPSTSPGTIRRT